MLRRHFINSNISNSPFSAIHTITYHAPHESEIFTALRQNPNYHCYIYHRKSDNELWFELKMLNSSFTNEVGKVRFNIELADFFIKDVIRPNWPDFPNNEDNTDWLNRTLLYIESCVNEVLPSNHDMGFTYLVNGNLLVSTSKVNSIDELETIEVPELNEGLFPYGTQLISIEEGTQYCNLAGLLCTSYLPYSLSISIPASVKKILLIDAFNSDRTGDITFMDDIIIDKNNPYYSSGDKNDMILDLQTGELLMFLGREIPANAKSLGFGCMRLGSNSGTVIIPNNIEELEYYSLSWFWVGSPKEIIFAEDSKITHLPGVRMGSDGWFYLFQGNDNLERIVLPKSITSIGDECFHKLSYPENVSLEYRGTVEEWEKITKGDTWNGNLTVVHCTDGDVAL